MNWYIIVCFEILGWGKRSSRDGKREFGPLSSGAMCAAYDEPGLAKFLISIAYPLFFSCFWWFSVVTYLPRKEKSRKPRDGDLQKTHYDPYQLPLGPACSKFHQVPMVWFWMNPAEDWSKWAGVPEGLERVSSSHVKSQEGAFLFGFSRTSCCRKLEQKIVFRQYVKNRGFAVAFGPKRGEGCQGDFFADIWRHCNSQHHKASLTRDSKGQVSKVKIDSCKNHAFSRLQILDSSKQNTY